MFFTSSVMAGLVPAIGRGTVPQRMAGTVAGHDGMPGTGDADSWA
jgi:hypothetical protein